MYDQKKTLLSFLAAVLVLVGGTAGLQRTVSAAECDGYSCDEWANYCLTRKGYIGSRCATAACNPDTQEFLWWYNGEWVKFEDSMTQEYDAVDGLSCTSDSVPAKLWSTAEKQEPVDGQCTMNAGCTSPTHCLAERVGGLVTRCLTVATPTVGLQTDRIPTTR